MRRQGSWLALALVAALAVPAGAQTSTDPSTDARFRADDGSIWHLNDNPALFATVDDVVSAGYSWSPDAGSPEGVQDVVLLSPLISFQLSHSSTQTRTDFASATSLGPALSFGYRSREVDTATTQTLSGDFGAVLRPFDLLSVGLTVDGAFGTAPTWGAGVALRPLAVVKGWGPLLTLTSDFALSGGTVVAETSGVHVALPAGLEARGWYNWSTGRPGVELSLTWGASESRVAAPTVEASNLRVGTAVRLTRQSVRTSPLPGAKVLRLRDVPALASAPQSTGFWARVLGGSPRPTVADLIDLIHRAADDPSVVALAFENPPVLPGAADAQDVLQALDALRQVGKRWYVYADNFGANGAFQTLWSHADRVSLNPNGTLDIHPLQTERLYLKDFLDKLGVRFANLAPWETKSYSNDLSFSSMPEGERAMNLRLMTQLQDQFSQSLASARASKLKGSATEVVNAGPYLIPQRAVDAGLLDAAEFRTAFEDAVTKAHGNPALVDDLAPSARTEWGASPLAKRVAVVHLAGDIVPGTGTAGTSIGLDAAEELQRLRDDPSVAALLLRVDSPGGVVLTADVIANEVAKTVEAGKLVVVSMGVYAASGGYYISAPATRIFAQGTTITGSIGVTLALPSVAGALDKLGIHPDGVALSPHAGFADPFKDFRAEDLKALNEDILTIYGRFLDVVSRGRKLTHEQVAALGEGQVWTGREALAKGLADELGSLADAKAWLEHRLGGRVDFVDVVPGVGSATAGLDELIPTSGLVKQVARVAGPALATWSRLADLGVGSGYTPLVFYEGALAP